MKRTDHTDKSALRSAILLTLVAGGVALGFGSVIAYGAQTPACDAVNSANGNFTMLDPTGGPVGGTNDVTFTWDGTIFNASSDYTGPGSTSNATLSSPTPFFGVNWTAHTVQIYGPGTYTFDATLGGGNSETGGLTMTVGPNQLGAHMLFNWSSSANIDVALVWDKNTTFGSAIESRTTVPPGGPNPGNNDASTVFMLASVDGNSDGIRGIPMAPNGPFPGFNANFNVHGALGPANGTCAPTIDESPDAISFTPVTNATTGVEYESNEVTISGLGTGVSASVSVTGGQYSIDGGAYTAAAGTIQNTQTIKVKGTAPAAGQTATVTLTVGTGTGEFMITTQAAAGAAGSNFTMFDPTGGVVGGTNDVEFDWDGSTNTDPNTAVVNATLVSAGPTPFFGQNWLAYNVKVYAPGVYTLSTTDSAGDGDCPFPAGQFASCVSGSDYMVTVGAGQLMAHMKFAWGSTQGIDVVVVWEAGDWMVLNPGRLIWSGPGGTYGGPTYGHVSTDWDGDGLPGGRMIDGPFVGYSANFSVVPTGTGEEIPLIPDLRTVETTSKTPGCSISTLEVSPLDRGDWWLVAGFIGWLAWLRRRAQKQSLH